MYRDALIEKCMANIDSFQELSEISIPIISDSVSVESSGLSGGAIVGIVVGVIFGLALLMVGIWKFLEKGKDNRKTSSDAVSGVNQQTVLTESVDPPSSNVHQPDMPTTVAAQLMTEPAAQSNNTTDAAVHNDNTHRAMDPPAQSKDDYALTFKDQSRSVIAPSPMAQAEVQPNSDATILPLVAAVPYQSVQMTDP
jgi:FtsZ-interacting cell division protein ZipA